MDFNNAKGLLELCDNNNLSISEVMKIREFEEGISSKEEIKNNINLDVETRKDLSEKLLEVANKLQELITNNQEVNYNDLSHEKARYLVISYIKEIEPLNENSIIDIKGWRNRAYKYSKYLIIWSNETKNL